VQRRVSRAMIQQGGVFCCLVLLISACGSTSATGNLAPFSQDGNSYSGAQWSPNGQWLAAAVFPTNTIHLFSPNGQVINTVSNCVLSGLGTDFAWTPDDRLSYLTAYPRQLQLLTLTQKGDVQKSTRIPLPILPGTIDWNFQWNPHHFWFAILAEPSPGSGASALYISDVNGHELLAPLNVNGAQQLAWSPDGTMLAVVQQSGDIVLFKIQQATDGKLILTTVRILPAGTPYYESIAWSPSGHWLVCRHISYNSEDYLYLFATDGSGKQIKITSSTTDGQLDSPAWSPDGKLLIVDQIAITGDTLMSLNIEQVLKEKGVQP